MKTADLLEIRPQQVKKVIYLSLAILAMEVISFVSQQGYERYWNLVVFLMAMGFSLLLMWGIWNGKNWVRWVWIVMALIGIPIALSSLARQRLEGIFAICVIQFILSLIILYYLTNKETVRWFQRKKMGTVLKGRNGDQQREKEDIEALKFSSREEYEKWKAEKLETAARRRKDDPPPQSESNAAPGEIWKDPLLEMEFIYVKPGWFEMTDNRSEEGENDERSVYTVYVDGYWMGKFPVTQGQWEKLMSHNPSVYKKGPDYPVGHVSWNDVQEFITELNQKTGMGFRLPTEEEWEYAARSGGREERWAGTNDEPELADYVWYDANSSGEPHPVGQKKPNGLGLYDMSGNIWEWVQRDYGVAGQGEIIRGGSWYNSLTFLRTSTKVYIAPDERVGFVGFRLVLPKKAS